ncbi:MAG: hypothetical protein PVF20_04085 [Desulfobacterales bacterium]
MGSLYPATVEVRGQSRGQVLKIAARLLEKSPVDIESEDLRQLRRNKAWATVALLATTMAAGVALFQWQVAERRADQLEADALRARSSELAASGRALATSRTPDTAIVLARHALAADGGSVANFERGCEESYRIWSEGLRGSPSTGAVASDFVQELRTRVFGD